MHDPLTSVDLHVEVFGKGPPIVCMHGGPGLDHTYLRPWLDPLSDVAQLVYYDHRGNGRSPRPPAAELSHDTWARDADDLRAALGHDQIVVFGHSHGGALGLEYAARFGHRLRGLVLCSSTPVLDYPETAMAKAMARGTPDQIAALAVAMSTPAGTDEEFRRRWTTLLPLYFHRFDRGVAGDMDERTVYSAAAADRGLLECLPSYDARPTLAGIECPTLILAGRHDWLMPPELGAARLEEGIPRAQSVVFEHSGHFPFIEEQEAFLASVRDWLGRLPEWGASGGVRTA